MAQVNCNFSSRFCSKLYISSCIETHRYIIIDCVTFGSFWFFKMWLLLLWFISRCLPIASCTHRWGFQEVAGSWVCGTVLWAYDNSICLLIGFNIVLGMIDRKSHFCIGWYKLISLQYGWNIKGNGSSLHAVSCLPCHRLVLLCHVAYLGTN